MLWNPAFWAEEYDRACTTCGAVNPSEPASPCWATENTEYSVSRSVGLRLFNAAAGMERPPVLIVTPQVNHSYVADFSERQSLVRTLLDAGAGRVGVTDWLPPPTDREYGIDDSIDDIQACVDLMGGQVHLVGLCQGGWQVAIVAALRPGSVLSLTVAAAPIDTHVGATLLHGFVFGLPTSFFEGLTRLGGGNAPGAFIAAGFDLLKPYERLYYNYASLYYNAHDQDFVDRYCELRNWYRLNKDVAGKLYVEVVRKLFKENRLARGELVVRGETVDLSRIEVPIHLLAGERDHITPREQVFALEALAPRAKAHRYLVDAGHIGVFMGRGALATAWPAIATTW